ncbi:MAG: hypothetical protein P4K93_13555 [Terracidiphilus sp.]|nr:hypothetical protein [Terracidiphilus sp.]
MIYAYGDDGSDEKHERVTAVSIIVGPEEIWREVEGQWTVRCGGIPFHATDCECNPPRGDYKGRLSHREAKDMYRDLVGILASSGLIGVGIGFDLAAQERTFPDCAELAYFRAFLECILQIAMFSDKIGEICEITYDISRENEARAAELYATLRESEEKFCRCLHSKISFQSWRDSARLQTGDMLAYEAWKALDHELGPIKRKRRSWELLRSTGQFETVAHSDEWFQSLKGHQESGELAKVAGFDAHDYESWLSKTGRTHNTGNMIKFIRSLNGKQRISEVRSGDEHDSSGRSEGSKASDGSGEEC